MTYATRRVRSLTLWFTSQVFTTSASLTSLLTMKPLILMFILRTSHTMTSMLKMVRVQIFLVITLFEVIFVMKSDHWMFRMSAEHFKPLFEQIQKLEEAIFNIQFEQHWLEAETDRQAIGTCFSMYNEYGFDYWTLRNTVFTSHTRNWYGLEYGDNNQCFICTKSPNLGTYVHITDLQWMKEWAGEQLTRQCLNQLHLLEPASSKFFFWNVCLNASLDHLEFRSFSSLAVRIYQL